MRDKDNLRDKESLGDHVFATVVCLAPYIVLLLIGAISALFGK